MLAFLAVVLLGWGRSPDEFQSRQEALGLVEREALLVAVQDDDLALRLSRLCAGRARGALRHLAPAGQLGGPAQQRRVVGQRAGRALLPKR